ncbi:MAG TPA: GatB/YqeY domain-containing protein [Bacteroidales bacterium]|nr:GatB/YqeY domain-containing protein [Bacteroidales bacterium]HSA44390.1 GatB/YqeY domain-containing protein [Bacteroidales bacterium]
MSLTEKINQDIKSAMLGREKEKLEALRAVKSALLLLGSEGGKQEINPEEEIRLLQKLVKQRKEAADIYRSQQREDLAGAELFQASVIEQYLPEQMSPEEMKVAVSGIIAKLGASSVKDMGRVMAAASAELSGKADNKTIAALVKEMLAV